MVNLFRSRLSATAVIIVFTVAACCSPSEPTDPCAGPPEATMSTTQPAGDMDKDQSMGDGMPTQACGLAKLSENGPEPPLYPGIGSAHWHVPWAQDYFDQGLRFYFGFNNRESYRAFHKAAAEAEDKGIPCSACYWAQALVLGVDLNMPKQSPSDLAAARLMLQQARNTSPNPEDVQIIGALSKRYQDCNTSDTPRECQRARNEGYYDGMKNVLKDFGSDDPNVITLFADAAMNITPWADREGANPVSERITEAKHQLERALNFVQYPRKRRAHPLVYPPDGAIAHAGRGLSHTRTCGTACANAGHLVHMPSHIYYRFENHAETRNTS